MELQNYNQDIISTSSSDIPPNYPNTNNPSFPQNKYSESQFQTQQQYNPPPSQQQYYQTQNIGYSSHPQNQSKMPTFPENQYPPQNYVQPITPVFQPPLGVDQNISQVNHYRITQPSKNVFLIIRRDIKTEIFSKLLVCSLIALFGILYYCLSKNPSIVIFLIIISPGIFIFIYGAISILCYRNYKLDIFLGDNTLTVVKRALCCWRKVTTNYQKNDLSRIEFTHRETKHRKRTRRGRYSTTTYDTYELFFIFKNGQRERILIDEEQKLRFKYTDEEKQFLVNYINNYINK